MSGVKGKSGVYIRTEKHKNQCIENLGYYTMKGRKYSQQLRDKCKNSWELLKEKRQGKRNPCWRGGRSIRYCIDCGKKLTEVNFKKPKKRCRKCYDNTKFGINNPNWRGGKSFEPYSVNFNQQLKDRIRVRDNFICQLCSVPELECQQRLSIHHIDYNKQNNDLNNLLSLCLSCNSKVNFNRKKWKWYFLQIKNLLL